MILQAPHFVDRHPVRLSGRKAATTLASAINLSGNMAVSLLDYVGDFKPVLSTQIRDAKSAPLKTRVRAHRIETIKRVCRQVARPPRDVF